MRLLRVQVSNFPLLEDIDFEIDPNGEQRCSAILMSRLDRPVLYLALQWAFYGNTDLPWPGPPVPCRPDSTDEPDGIPTVRIDYSVADAGGDRECSLVRSATPDWVGRRWRIPDGYVELSYVTAAGTRRVGSGGDLVATHFPKELRSTLFCSSDDEPLEWYGKRQPALSTQITGGPLAALRAVDSHGVERIGRDFSPLFRVRSSARGSLADPRSRRRCSMPTGCS